MSILNKVGKNIYKFGETDFEIWVCKDSEGTSFMFVNGKDNNCRGLELSKDELIFLLDELREILSSN